ncbi:MAG: helix-turn-helix domain-containing protein [Myxococcales bacterium]|nr:helix-turn-helix domain-containing protein [Myxococcales bacterium]
MKSLSEQNHYEILEVPRGCDTAEIERAYRLSIATYADDALAGYSIFEDGDAEMIRERVETAYRVLSDDDTRRVYDESLQAWWSDESGAISTVAPSAGEVEVPEARSLQQPVETLEDLGDVDEEEGEFDGARLRRTRVRLGIEIDDVGRVTKVNPVYLRFIEEERFEELPARVYVRGFVTAYASCVGIDSRRAVESYMRRFDASGPAPQRRFSTGG